VTSEPREHKYGVVIPNDGGGPPYLGCRNGFHDDVCADGIWICATRRFGFSFAWHDLLLARPDEFGRPT
jgi:hypothetical protein